MKIVKMALTVSLLTGLLLLAGAIAPKAVQACSCVEPVLTEQMKSQDAVFVGEAVSSKTKGFTAFSSTLDKVEYEFRVAEVWKGQVTSQLKVYSTAGSDSCGMEFKQGESYLVFAKSIGGKLETGLCGGTKLLSGAGAELSQLGQGSKPPALDFLTSKTSSAGAWMVTLLAVVLLAVLIGYAYYRRRTSHRL
ncbi:hypothetical protein [Paenibacillus sp. NPDC058071]|uniref:hypothetical protein n=1 Tax=Paenibacillus sp. NPDC058071 TaxID=3346326 RepID=UPI0036DE3310